MGPLLVDARKESVVVAGSTNLYLVSRRWGDRVLQGRVGTALHVNDASLARGAAVARAMGSASRDLRPALPGFRLPITLVAGTLRMRYPVFAASVAISTSLWVAVRFAIETRFGRKAGRFLGGHRWTYLIIAGVVLLAIVAVIVRAVHAQLRSDRAGG